MREPRLPAAVADERGGLDSWGDVVRAERRVGVSLRAPLAVGLLTLAIGFGGFGTWAANTRIAAAAIAAGRLVPDGAVKTVTHFEGGTLASLEVRDGDVVAAGDVLMRLDVTRARARLDQLEDHILGLELRLARLRAERDGAAALALSDDLLARTAERPALVAAERDLFAGRRAALAEAADAERTGLALIAARREALAAERASLEDQRAIVGPELETLEDLFARGLAVRAQVADARLLVTRIAADLRRVDADLVGLAREEDRVRLERQAREAEMRRTLEAELQEAQLALAGAEHERTTARDVVSKAEIRAPVSGTVTAIRLVTPGSALIAGQPLMDIVPLDRPLVVEARVRPRDIDNVRVGMEAEVRLTAFPDATNPPIPLRLTYVAADATVDPSTKEIYYVARLEIDRHNSVFRDHSDLHPGMVGEVFVIAEDRTALDYIISPIATSLSRAMRED